MRWRATILTCLLGLGARAGPLDDIGLTALRGRPGALRADGAGISVAQVEAPEHDAYTPDFTSAQFADMTFQLYGITQQTSSAHATDVGGLLYGTTGVAPGVGSVKLFSDTTFMGTSGLYVGQQVLPAKLGVRVINNSWIGDSGDAAWNSDALRRLDYMIVRDNVFVASALGNSDSTSAPILLAASFNGMAVGTPASAGSTASFLTFDATPAGRARTAPDIIAPTTTTSEATALVSGSAALLMSEAKARKQPVSSLATRAMLLAGAEQLSGWQRGRAGKADDVKLPLDPVQGAGMLRVDRSFDILRAGKLKPNNTPKTTGWTVGKVQKGSRVDFNMTLTKAATHFAAALTWNRQIPDSVLAFADRTPVLSRLVLSLQKQKGKKWVLLSRSAAQADNVDFILRNSLEAGSYRLSVTSDRDEAFALAWMTDFKPYQTMLTTPLSSLAQPANITPASGTQVVPEPTGATWLAIAALALGRRRGRARKAGTPPTPVNAGASGVCA